MARRSAASPASSPARLSETGRLSYWHTAQRPLQILLFLFPLVLAYEICLAVVLSGDDGLVNTVEAHKRLLDFFAAFGIAPGGGLYLGGVAIIVVLLVWHVLKRDPWRLDLNTVGLMAIEALVLTVPLLIFARFVAQSGLAAVPIPPAPGAGGTLGHLDLLSRLAIAVGAGLYEELLFRMLLIAVLHTLLVDVVGASARLGAILSIAVAAAAFTWYHPLETTLGSGVISWRKVAFYFAAGLYFGSIFLLRGFGIVVAVHAIYDIVMVVLLSHDTP